MRYGTVLLACAVVALSIGARAEPAKAPTEKFEQTGNEWPLHGGSWSNTRYSTLSQANGTNVKTLGAAWNFDLGSEISHGPPVVADGMMFIAAAGGHITALDAATGAVKWSYLPSGPGVDARNRGLAVGGGKVYFGLTDGSVSAIDEKTGKAAWTTYIGDGPARFGMFVSAAPT